MFTEYVSVVDSRLGGGDIKGRGAGRNFEINKFLLKNVGNDICTHSPGIYCIKENVKKKTFSRCLDMY